MARTALALGWTRIGPKFRHRRRKELTMSENMLGKVLQTVATAPTGTLGTLCDLLEKLRGKNGGMWLTALKRFLRQENPWALKLIRQETLRIGRFSKDELLKLLEEAGFYVSDWAKSIMERIKFLKRPKDVELGWIRVRDLFGDENTHTTTELVSRIKEIGDLCPAEVGPHLRRHDKDQPKGEWYYVIHEPIPGVGGYPRVFLVGLSLRGDRSLDGAPAHAGCLWGPEFVVVFCLRK